MRSATKLLLALVLLLGVALALTLSGWGGADEEPRRALSGGLGAGGGAAEPPALTVEETRGPDAVIEPLVEEPELSIRQPLRIELELVRAKGELAAEDAPVRGSGARAGLRGALYGADGKGVSGEVAFVGGANAGRALACDLHGRFGALDLYPGLGVVEVSVLGYPPAMRELRLRNGSTEELNIGFGRPASVYGTVVDTEGQPIPYATVLMDGQKATTDEQGIFHFPRMTSGRVLTIVRKPGYASYRELTGITAGHTIQIGRLSYVLEPGARLEVTVQERVGARSDALLFVEPDHDYRNPGMLTQRKYPWHLVSPVRIAPGSTVTIEDLPAMRVRLRLAHAGARARPAVKSVALVPERAQHVVLHLEPAPKLRGRVTRDGQPVHKAKVTLEVPDVALGTAKILDQPMGMLESEVMPNLPPALQTTYTSGLGEFELSAAEDLSAVRYLTAVGPDGEGWAGRVLRKGESEIELELRQRVVGRTALSIDTLPRALPVPLEVRVNGTPLDRPWLLPGEDFVVPDLAAGTWKVRARWHKHEILSDQEIVVDGDEVSLFLDLPPAARQGPTVADGS